MFINSWSVEVLWEVSAFRDPIEIAVNISNCQKYRRHLSRLGEGEIFPSPLSVRYSVKRPSCKMKIDFWFFFRQILSNKQTSRHWMRSKRRYIVYCTLILIIIYFTEDFIWRSIIFIFITTLAHEIWIWKKKSKVLYTPCPIIIICIRRYIYFFLWKTIIYHISVYGYNWTLLCLGKRE